MTFPEPGHFKIFGDHIRLQRLGWYRIERRAGDPYAHFECVACGRGCNADINAALNILALGTGAAGRGGGGVARPVKRQEMGESALADLAA